MIQYSVVTEQPDLEPVELDEAKEHLEYYGTLKDRKISDLITTARRMCEEYTGLSLVTQTRRMKLDRFPTNALSLQIPYGPVQYIESFTYLNEDGTTTTLVENTDFKVDYHSKMARIYMIDDQGEIDTWPTDYRAVLTPIEIVYVAGFDDVSGQQTPPQAKNAILRLVARLFEDRGDVGDLVLDWGTQTMLDDIKVVWNAEPY